VAKTGRCVIVHEAARTGGFGAEIAALIAERGLTSLLKEMTARLEGEVAALRTGGRADGSTDGLGQAARRLGHLAATIVEADRKACR